MKIASSIADLPTGKPLYLYGAGQGGTVVLEALRGTPGHDVRAFIDTYKSGEQDGLPIVTLERFLRDRPEGAEVAIVSQYYLEIGGQLRQAGFGGYINAHPLVMGLLNRRAARRRLIRIGIGVAAVALIMVAWLS